MAAIAPPAPRFVTVELVSCYLTRVSPLISPYELARRVVPKLPSCEQWITTDATAPGTGQGGYNMHGMTRWFFTRWSVMFFCVLRNFNPRREGSRCESCPERGLTSQRRHRSNQMKATTPSKSIKKMMAVRTRHHDLVPRSILNGGSRP
jgi:hypothetical protein